MVQSAAVLYSKNDVQQEAQLVSGGTSSFINGKLLDSELVAHLNASVHHSGWRIQKFQPDLWIHHSTIIAEGQQ